MYFPFFRARQYELLALRDTISSINSDQVKPIIEPVVEGTRDIYRFCDEFSKAGAGFIFVVNPSKGYFVRNQKSILNLIEECANRNPLIEFALRVNDETPLKNIKSFISEFSNFPVSLIHESSIEEVDDLIKIIDAKNFRYNIFCVESTGRLYRNKFHGWDNVLLRDSFNRQEPNSAYEGEEYFSDQVYTYKSDGHFGFGDYSVVGDHFSEGGGGAKACAIHITYEKPDEEEVWVKHFLSEPRDYVEDGATLASEAIEELVNFIQDNWDENQFTKAIDEFIALHEEGRQTSLAFVKKLAMRHHLELINRII
ncbi:TPA: sce7725 family protein [Vibrio parahaemolyticus]|nr:sce7725 family protein [Vibrio parahaemolyticus]